MNQLEKFFDTSRKSRMIKKMHSVLDNAVIEIFHTYYLYYNNGDNKTEVTIHLDGNKNSVIKETINGFDYRGRDCSQIPNRKYHIYMSVSQYNDVEFISICNIETGQTIAHRDKNLIPYTEKNVWDDITNIVYAVWNQHK